MKGKQKDIFKIVPLFILFLVGASSFAQSHTSVISPEYEERLIPNNPNVSSLGTFGFNPMDKYTGTANISIPLHSIDFDGLTIPLNLNYNTGGIKVAQEASWVGLGWNLGSGGYITSEINGFDDTKGNNTDDQPLGFIYADNYLTRNSPLFQLEITEADETALVIANQSGGPRDTEPDIFTATLFGKSVKFALDKLEQDATVAVGRVVGTTFRKVLFDTEDLSFEITDEEGFVYHFEHVEYSTPYVSRRGTYNNIETEEQHIREIHEELNSIHDLEQDRVSWQISRVVSPYGHEITFEYQRTLNISYPSISEQVDLQCNQLFGSRIGPNPYVWSVNNNPEHTARFFVFENVTLNKISGDFGTIDFNLGNREDLFSDTSFRSFIAQESTLPLTYKMPVLTTEAPKKLNSMVVKNMLGNVVKTISFEHSYFNSQKLGDTDQENYVRLKLDGVSINERNYDFDYVNPDNLPGKRSKAIDFWGFYNGANNPHRVPKFERYNASWSSGAPGYEFYLSYDNGTTRKSNFNFGCHGILNKVTYPTGGYTSYVYEPNTVSVLRPDSYDPFYDTNGNFKSSTLSNTSDYSWNYQYLKMAEDPNYSFVNASEACNVNGTLYNRNDEFTIAQTAVCDLNYNVRINTTLSCTTGCGEGIAPSGQAVWIRNLDNNQIIPVFNFTQPSNNPNGLWTLELEDELNLPPGNYRFETQPAWSNPSPLVVVTNNSSLRLFTQELINPPTAGDTYEEFQVGGARVQKVLEHDFNGTLLSSRAFDYSEQKASGMVKSSGVLMNQLQYHSKNNGFFEYTPEQYYGNTTNVHSDNILRMRYSAAGKHLGYSKVTETIVSTANESANNGRIETEFFNEPNEYVTRFIGNTPSATEISGPDTFYGNVNLNAVLPKCYDYYNGRLLTERLYTSGNALRTETINEYEVSGAGTFIQDAYAHISYQLYVLPTTCDASVCGFFPELPYFKPVMTDDTSDSNFARIKKSTQTKYETNGQLTTITDYFYGTGPHYLPSRVTTTDAYGGLITTKNFYPVDFPTDPMIDGLTNENRHTDVVKSEVFRGTTTNPESTMVTTKEIKYDMRSPGTLIMPSEVITLKGIENANNALDRRVTYNKYDDKGNLLEYQQEDGTLVSHIWGYNREYVVAQVVNASYADIQGIFTTGNLNNIGVNGLTTGQANTLRNGLPEAFVTTYVYDPMIGVTSMTDPRGYTMKYTYDEFNRLEYVIDGDDHVVSKNQYQYKNQN